MVQPGELSGHAQLFTVATESIEALERLHDSYKGVLSDHALTEADQAVLVAVEIILRQVRSRQQLA